MPLFQGFWLGERRVSNCFGGFGHDAMIMGSGPFGRIWRWGMRVSNGFGRDDLSKGSWVGRGFGHGAMIMCSWVDGDKIARPCKLCVFYRIHSGDLMGNDLVLIQRFV